MSEKIKQEYNILKSCPYTCSTGILMKLLEVTLEYFFDTRWSSTINASIIKSIYKQLPRVKCALINITENGNPESIPTDIY